MGLNITVNYMDILNKLEIVQDVDDHDVEEEEHDCWQNESINQDVLVFDEGVEAQSPKYCADVANQTDDVVGIDPLGVQEDISVTNSARYLPLEGTDPAHR